MSTFAYACPQITRFGPAVAFRMASVAGMPIHIPGLHGAFPRADAVQSFGRHEVGAALARGEVLSPWRASADPLRGADPMTIISAAWLAHAGCAGHWTLRSFPARADSKCLILVDLVVPYETHKRSRTGIFVHNGMSSTTIEKKGPDSLSWASTAFSPISPAR